eukprot:2470881-Amphidinium_carterae.1
MGSAAPAGQGVTLCLYVTEKLAFQPTSLEGTLEAPNGTQLSFAEYVDDAAYSSLAGCCHEFNVPSFPSPSACQ